MYSKLGNLKIIQLKSKLQRAEGPLNSLASFLGPARDARAEPANLRTYDLKPYPFVGVINHKLISGLIVSSKINRLRKDGMTLQYFNNNYILNQTKESSLNKLRQSRSLPLPLEFKLFGFQLIAKKYIKSLSWSYFF